VIALPASAERAVIRLAVRCEQWLSWEAEDVRDGFLLDAADCCDEAQRASLEAFAIVGAWS